MSDVESGLSDGAERLLSCLRQYAYSRKRAMTDKMIAGVIGVCRRSVIDLADELIRAGFIVIAECTPPHGRWLVTSKPSMAEAEAARAYAQNLHERGVAVLTRCARLKRAIERTESRRPVETTGQGRLF